MRATRHGLRIQCTARQAGDFSPEWLAALRFISRRKTSGPPALQCYVGPSGVGAFTSEVKRSAASHEDVKAPTPEGRGAMSPAWPPPTTVVAPNPLNPGRIRAPIRTP